MEICWFFLVAFLSPTVTAEEKLNIEEFIHKHDFMFSQVEKTFDDMALESKRYRAQLTASLGQMGKDMNDQWDEVALKLVDLHSKTDEMEGKLEGLESKIARLESKLDEQELKVQEFERLHAKRASNRKIIQEKHTALAYEIESLYKQNADCLNTRGLQRLENRKLYHFSTVKRNWQNSKKYCQSVGMQLASPKTGEDVRLLSDNAILFGGTSYGFWWLSASDVGRATGDFRWHDGRVLSRTSELWYKVINCGTTCAQLTAMQYVN